MSDAVPVALGVSLRLALCVVLDVTVGLPVGAALAVVDSLPLCVELPVAACVPVEDSDGESVMLRVCEDDLLRVTLCVSESVTDIDWLAVDVELRVPVALAVRETLAVAVPLGVAV